MGIFRAIGIIIAAVLLAIPFTFVAAIASVPLLRDIEARWDIEVVGHSGPADWVIWMIWLVISAALAATIWRLGTTRKTAE